MKYNKRFASALLLLITGMILFASCSGREHYEGRTELISQSSWISAGDGSEHTVSEYTNGETAKNISSQLGSNIVLKHKLVDGIPVYEMYASDKTRKKMVFFIHGQMSRKEEFLEEMPEYAEAGYFCVTIDLAGHGERISSETIMSLEAITITGMDIDTLLDYYSTSDNADPASFAIIGFSQGGSVAYWYTAFGSHEPSAIVVGSTTPDFNYYIDKSCIRDGKLYPSIWSDEEISDHISLNSPVSKAEEFYSLPIMSGNSLYDDVVSYKGSEEFERLLIENGNENAFFYYFDNGDHDVTEEFVQKILPFIKSYL